jgi:hypothetical protein
MLIAAASEVTEVVANLGCRRCFNQRLAEGVPIGAS